MKRKKKWTSCLAAVLLSGCLAACGDGKEQTMDGVPENDVSVEGNQTTGGEDGNQIDKKSEDGTTKNENQNQSDGTSEGENQSKADAATKGESQGQADDTSKAETENRENVSGQVGEALTYSFTDDLGREVTISSCERVAALLGSYADMWVLAGGGLVAAPDDAFEDFGLTLSEDTVNLGGTKSLSLELLLSADPDFVVASTNTTQHLEWQQALEGAGIAVAYFDVACFEDYLRVLKICTDITGQAECYEKYGADLKGQIDAVLAQHQGETAPRVLFMRASAASIRAKGNEGNVLGEMLSAFGCTNIADTDDSLLENLSIESIVLQNPDKILVLPVGDDLEAARQGIEAMFEENPIWKELDAVKNGEVYYLDKHLYNLKPNARWAEAYEKLAEILFTE